MAGKLTMNGKKVLSALKFAFIQGGSAGDHTLTGVAVGDDLLCVTHLTTAAEATYGFTASSCVDRTSEFSITAANTINNTGGTDTSNDFLLIVWEDVSAQS